MNKRIICLTIIILLCCASSYAQNKPAIKFYSTKHNKYIAFDTLKFLIPKNVHIDSNNVYNGIHELSGNTLKRRKSMVFNGYAMVTTFEDLGMGIRGYLYVFNTRNKLLIRDTAFQRAYLYSSAGIFIIDPVSEKIFSIDKPEWYDKKNEGIIPASIDCIKGPYFKDLRIVYKVGSEIPEDKALISFFKGAMDGDSREALGLPKDWWKTK